MKHYIVMVAFSLLLSHAAWAAETPAQPATAKPIVAEDPDNYQAIFINDQMKITPNNRHEEDASQHSVINVDYPQITGEKLSAAAEQFNSLIVTTINQEVDQFKQYVKEDTIHMQTLPESVKHNEFKVDYDIDIVHSDTQPIVVVRFAVEGMQAGRAHPYHYHRVVNFDLANNKVLTLHDIFKPNANYLTVLASYTNQKLNETLQDKFMIKEGTAPNAKNYQLWNLESDGILITFDEYQVAPYHNGPQEVHIPFEALKGIISPEAPITRA